MTPQLKSSPRQRDRDRKLYLGASSDGDDTSEEIPDNRFQGRRQTIYVDGVDQPQAVLFNQETQRSRVNGKPSTEATAGFHTQTAADSFTQQGRRFQCSQVFVWSQHVCLQVAANL